MSASSPHGSPSPPTCQFFVRKLNTGQKRRSLPSLPTAHLKKGNNYGGKTSKQELQSTGAQEPHLCGVPWTDDDLRTRRKRITALPSQHTVLQKKEELKEKSKDFRTAAAPRRSGPHGHNDQKNIAFLVSSLSAPHRLPRKEDIFLRASASLLSSPQTFNLTNLQNARTGQASHGRKVGAARTGAIQRKKSPGKTFQRLYYFASSRVMQKHEERSKLQKSSPPPCSQIARLWGERKLVTLIPPPFTLPLCFRQSKRIEKSLTFAP